MPSPQSSSADANGRPITVALVNDYDIIVHGLAAMLEPFDDRLEVIDLEVGGETTAHADVALFDTFAGRRHALARSETMVKTGRVDHVVLYTWDASADFLTEAVRVGVSGVLLKSQPAHEVVRSVERIVAGERLGLEHVARGRQVAEDGQLSAREQEVLALLALGMSNREIGAELYVSPETVKTYVRRIFTKLGVSNRVQAASKAAEHAVGPPRSRLGA